MGSLPTNCCPVKNFSFQLIFFQIRSHLIGTLRHHPIKMRKDGPVNTRPTCSNPTPRDCTSSRRKFQRGSSPNRLSTPITEPGCKNQAAPECGGIPPYRTSRSGQPSAAAPAKGRDRAQEPCSS